MDTEASWYQIAIASKEVTAMRPITIDDHWKERSDFTIHQAVLLTLGIDPDDYWLTVQGLPQLSTTPADNSEEEDEAIGDKINAMRSAIRSGVIRVTHEVQNEFGIADEHKTYLAKDDLILWWQQHGYRQIADIFTAYANRGLEDTTGVLSVPTDTEANIVDVSGLEDSSPSNQNSALERSYRGCKRHIVEHWSEIKKFYGADADGRQVIQTGNDRHFDAWLHEQTGDDLLLQRAAHGILAGALRDDDRRTFGHVLSMSTEGRECCEYLNSWDEKRGGKIWTNGLKPTAPRSHYPLFVHLAFDCALGFFPSFVQKSHILLWRQ